MGEVALGFRRVFVGDEVVDDLGEVVVAGGVVGDGFDQGGSLGVVALAAFISLEECFADCRVRFYQWREGEGEGAAFAGFAEAFAKAGKERLPDCGVCVSNGAEPLDEIAAFLVFADAALKPSEHGLACVGMLGGDFPEGYSERVGLADAAFDDLHTVDECFAGIVGLVGDLAEEDTEVGALEVVAFAAAKVFEDAVADDHVA